MRPNDVAYRLHTSVGVDFEGTKEPIRVPLNRGVALIAHLLCANHALGNSVVIHQLDKMINRVGVFIEVRRLLEHVLRWEFKIFPRLFVVQLWLEELVVVAAVVDRKADHQINHANVCGHHHAIDHNKQSDGPLDPRAEPAVI